MLNITPNRITNDDDFLDKKEEIEKKEEKINLPEINENEDDYEREIEGEFTKDIFPEINEPETVQKCDKIIMPRNKLFISQKTDKTGLAGGNIVYIIIGLSFLKFLF
jgi:hypothetical protein